MDNNMIINADILKWAEEYDGSRFHAAFMDSPYEMQFMGKGWDNSGIAFRPETWEAIARHLHPGGWIVSFGGSRTWHRMACAMEDAGLIIQPTMFLWAYGSGFPKATRIDTQIDRRAGADRAVVGQRKHAPKFDAAGHGYREKDNGYNSRDRESFDVTAPATELARDWAGHRYGGQAIKPAVEPIIFAQKPYDGAPVESMTRTGAGALWIDGARIGTSEDMNPRDFDDSRRTSPKFSHVFSGGTLPLRASKGEVPNGRWPANLVLSHHPACNGTCAPDCPVRRLGEQSGESTSKASQRGQINVGQMAGGSSKGGVSTERGHNDAGTAARYFYDADWQLERLEAADPVGYYAKASKSEREAGLDDMQVRLLRELYDMDGDDFEDDTINDGRPTPIDNPYQRGETTRKNIHPTVKPIALNRWLATLLLPPPRYAPRRLLVPFAGVASEYIGAVLAGWEEIVGVELEEQHVRIAEARIAFWQQMKHKLMNPDAPIKVRVSSAPDGQLELF